MANSLMPESVAGLSAIASSYRAILCDVWGVIHNGVSRFDPACEALARYRSAGGVVLLLTNAPRPRPPVVAQLGALRVGPDVYDEVITSGDVTRRLLLEHGDRTILHLGPDRDWSLYDGLGLAFGTAEEAKVISCTGLYDEDHEVVADYDARLLAWAARDLLMICANPDLVVARGNQMILCAGALAERYAEFGGRVLVAGKPHPPMYDAALADLAARFGEAPDPASVLAIGDGIDTDIRGAVSRGLDTLFITGGIHGADLDA
ncbi:MAG: TIGR01459 family HAD-type hydrolase, partial [Bauldia sp.]|nr:TIGR01459 family HAD-type hydrolase [Bauldia sp.]